MASVVKKCKKCQEIKDLNEFRLRNTGQYRRECKKCERVYIKKYTQDKVKNNKNFHKEKYQKNRKNCIASVIKYQKRNPKKVNYRNSLYRAKKLMATPAWADLEEIKNIYKNCPTGFEVDHIIPLQGINVCGLHVESNLQYLTQSENRKKSNKFGGEKSPA